MLRILRPFSLVFAMTMATQAPALAEVSHHSCELLMSAVLIHDNNYESTHFPINASLDFSRPKLGVFFRLNEKLWLKNFDRDRLLRIIRDIANNTPLSDEDAAEYRGDRARLKQLRFAFGLFDVDHEYPDFVDDVTTTMGHLQDAQTNNQPAVVAANAAKLQVLLSGENWRNFDRELQSFRPSSGGSFTAYISAQIHALEVSLNKPKVTGQQFHEMRKVISRLLAFFDTVNTLNPGRANQGAVEFLSTLNGRMGAMHNELISQHFAHSIDYDHDKFKLPADVRTMLKTLVDAFDTILN